MGLLKHSVVSAFRKYKTADVLLRKMQDLSPASKRKVSLSAFLSDPGTEKRRMRSDTLRRTAQSCARRLSLSGAVCGGRSFLCPNCTYIQTLFKGVHLQRRFSSPAGQRAVQPVRNGTGKLKAQQRPSGAAEESTGLPACLLWGQSTTGKTGYRRAWAGERPVRKSRGPRVSPEKKGTCTRGGAASPTSRSLSVRSRADAARRVPTANRSRPTVESGTSARDAAAGDGETHEQPEGACTRAEGRHHGHSEDKESGGKCVADGSLPVGAASGGTHSGNDSISFCGSDGETALDVREPVTPPGGRTDTGGESAAVGPSKKDGTVSGEQHPDGLQLQKQPHEPEERIPARSSRASGAALARGLRTGESDFSSLFVDRSWEWSEAAKKSRRHEDCGSAPHLLQPHFPRAYTSSAASSSHGGYPRDLGTRLVVAAVTAAVSSVVRVLTARGPGGISSLDRSHAGPVPFPLQAVAEPLREALAIAVAKAGTLGPANLGSSGNAGASFSTLEFLSQAAASIGALRDGVRRAAAGSLSHLPSAVSATAMHAASTGRGPGSVETSERAYSVDRGSGGHGREKGRREAWSSSNGNTIPGSGLRLLLEYLLMQLQNGSASGALRAVEERLTETLMHPLEWHQFDPVSHELRRQSQKREEELSSRQGEVRSSPLSFQASLYSIPPASLWTKENILGRGHENAPTAGLAGDESDRHVRSARGRVSSEFRSSSGQETPAKAGPSPAARQEDAFCSVSETQQLPGIVTATSEAGTDDQEEERRRATVLLSEATRSTLPARDGCSGSAVWPEDATEVERRLLQRLYCQECLLERHLKRVQELEQQLTASIQRLGNMQENLLSTSHAPASSSASFSPAAVPRSNSDFNRERGSPCDDTGVDRYGPRSSASSVALEACELKASERWGLRISPLSGASTSPTEMRPDRVPPVSHFVREEREGVAEARASPADRGNFRQRDTAGPAPREDLRVRSLPSTPLRRFAAFASLLMQLAVRASFTALTRFCRRLLRLPRAQRGDESGPVNMQADASVVSAVRPESSEGAAAGGRRVRRALQLDRDELEAGVADAAAARADQGERHLMAVKADENEASGTAAREAGKQTSSPSGPAEPGEPSSGFRSSTSGTAPETTSSGGWPRERAQTVVSTKQGVALEEGHDVCSGGSHPAPLEHVRTPGLRDRQGVSLPVPDTACAPAAVHSGLSSPQGRTSCAEAPGKAVSPGTAHGDTPPVWSPSSNTPHESSTGAALADTRKEAEQQRQPRGVSGVGLVDEILNDERVVKLLTDRMCRMRGAALKLMQMVSMIEGSLPPALAEALKRTRDSADVMPEWQLLATLERELGGDWRRRFASFEMVPFASASIGQVHRATLPDGRRVAVKVQFPGIAESICSDLRNLKMLVQWTRILPRSLFLDVLCDEMKTELLAECNYSNERGFYEHFRFLLERDFASAFYVPRVHGDNSTKKVLVTDFVDGLPLEQVASRQETSQRIRDSISERLVKLVLTEIFVYRLMNTDPNPSNFFYLPRTDSVALIDFGAGRTYDPVFVDKYLRLLHAAVHENETGKKYSFKDSEVFGLLHAEMQKVMMNRERPPPPEIYSLHRKLAGCFLLCAKLGGQVDTPKLFVETLQAYRAPDGGPFQPEPGLD